MKIKKLIITENNSNKMQSFKFEDAKTKDEWQNILMITQQQLMKEDNINSNNVRLDAIESPEILNLEENLHTIDIMDEFIHKDIPEQSVPRISTGDRKSCYRKESKILQRDQMEHVQWDGVYIKDEKGQLEQLNQDLIGKQRGVLKDLIFRMGKNVLAGKGIMGVSMPVSIFSGETLLQLHAKSLAYMSSHIKATRDEKDPLLMLVQQVREMMCILNNDIDLTKPFNPILGETYNCHTNTMNISLEQTSHHPPITSYYLNGNGFHAYGYTEIIVKTSANSARASKKGIEFVVIDHECDKPIIRRKSQIDQHIRPDKLESNVCQQMNFSGVTFEKKRPWAIINGLAMGRRTFTQCGKSWVKSKELNLFCEILFDPNDAADSQFSKSRTGTIIGLIYASDTDRNMTSQPRNSWTNVIAEISGEWNNTLVLHTQGKPSEEIFNVANSHFMAENVYPDCKLPSDSLLREDLIDFHSNYSRCQETKEKLENIQRDDRKLRAKLKERHPCLIAK